MQAANRGHGERDHSHSPLGSLLVGILADFWGTPRALAASAAVPLVIVGVIALCVPAIRRLH